MTDECPYYVPDDASEEEMRATLDNFHAYIHALEDEIRMLRESIYNDSQIFTTTAEVLAEGNSFGSRKETMQYVITNMAALAVYTALASGVDLQAKANEEAVDRAFEDIVGRIEDE